VAQIAEAQMKNTQEGDLVEVVGGPYEGYVGVVLEVVGNGYLIVEPLDNGWLHLRVKVLDTVPWTSPDSTSES
jgi:hypothetical protein